MLTNAENANTFLGNLMIGSSINFSDQNQCELFKTKIPLNFISNNELSKRLQDKKNEAILNHPLFLFPSRIEALKNLFPTKGKRSFDLWSYPDRQIDFRMFSSNDASIPTAKFCYLFTF